MVQRQSTSPPGLVSNMSLPKALLKILNSFHGEDMDSFPGGYPPPPPPKTNVTTKKNPPPLFGGSFIGCNCNHGRRGHPWGANTRTRVMLVNAGVVSLINFSFPLDAPDFEDLLQVLGSGTESTASEVAWKPKQISTGHLGKWWSRQCSGISGETMDILEIQWKKYRRVN